MVPCHDDVVSPEEPEDDPCGPLGQGCQIMEPEEEEQIPVVEDDGDIEETEEEEETSKESTETEEGTN